MSKHCDGSGLLCLVWQACFTDDATFYFRWFKLCWMGLITYLRWVTSIVLHTVGLLPCALFPIILIKREMRCAEEPEGEIVAFHLLRIWFNSDKYQMTL